MKTKRPLRINYEMVLLSRLIDVLILKLTPDKGVRYEVVCGRYPTIVLCRKEDRDCDLLF